jgi:hypothetical protein
MEATTTAASVTTILAALRMPALLLVAGLATMTLLPLLPAISGERHRYNTLLGSRI